MRRSLYNTKPLSDGVAVAAILVLICAGMSARLLAATGGGPSLIAHWKLDESSGQMATDSVGGHGGVVNGSPQWRLYGGRLDGALEFGGVNEYVDCGNAGVFDLTDGITVSAWVNIGEVRYDWQAIVTKGDSAWRLSTVNRERRFHFGITGGPDFEVVNGSTTVKAGEWHHVCGTYDGQYLRLYLDGEPDASALQYTGGMGVNAFPVQIGANAEQLNRRWKGLIDDVRVYDGALTAGQVRALYREAPLYVDADSPGGNGSSWFSAFRSLQDALLQAGAGCRIHVAAGLYRPDAGGGWTKGDRNATFVLKSALIIRGGYAGYGQPNPSLRDTVLFETILSGDLCGDDVVAGDPCDMFADPLRSENSRHVVSAIGVGADILLEGFTITGGQADGSDGAFPRVNNGAGLYSSNSHVTVSNCTFRRNAAVVHDTEYGGRGAAVYCEGGVLTLSDCVLQENAALYGAVFGEEAATVVVRCRFSRSHGSAFVGVSGATGAITDCVFVDNEAGFGGAVLLDQAGIAVRRCAFFGNAARLNGGAIQLYRCAPPVSNSLFSANIAVIQSGGAVAAHEASPNIVNCTFVGNVAQQYGGGIYCFHNSHPTVVNTVLWDNSASAGGSQVAMGYDQGGPGNPPSASSVSIAYCDVRGGRGDVYGDPGSILNWGAGNINADPLFFDPHGVDGIPGTADDNLRLRTGSPCINSGDNSAVGTGETDLEGHPRILDATVDMGAHEHRPAIYVDIDATGAGTGVDWANALTSLQDALAGAGTGAEIRVAAGVYRPDRGAGLPPGDRSLTFRMPEGIVLRGSYAGFGASDPDARDSAAHPTILSGDLAGNDAPGFVNYAENSYRVVTLGSSGVLDGLTVTAGCANLEGMKESGAGVFIAGGSPTITDCRFYANKATTGGALHIAAGSPVIAGCRFESNMAVTSGAVYNQGSSRFERCVFFSNSAERAAALADHGAASIIACVFTANTSTGLDANSGAGALFNEGRCSIVNCLFNANVALARGGAIWAWQADMDITNCTFVDNTSPTGPAIVCWSQGMSAAGVRILNSAFQRTVNPIVNLDGSPVSVRYCNLAGFWAGEGNISAPGVFVDPDGPDDMPATLDDDFRLRAVSLLVNAGLNAAIPFGVDTDLVGEPRITHNTVDIGAYEFQGTLSWYVDGTGGNDLNDGMTPETAFATIQRGINAASTGFTVAVYPGVYHEALDFRGKAITVTGIADAPVLQISGNYAVSFYTAEGADTVLRNFVITGCEIGVFIMGSSPTITNVTIAGNGFGVTAYAGANPQISNCILWDNSGGDLYGCTARYSCIRDNVPGPGNLSVNPLFADPMARDYHLKSTRGRYDPIGDVWVLDEVTSPCIDAGDPSMAIGSEPVPHGRRANLGAYGRSPTASLSDRSVPGDVNGDGLVNLLDIAVIAENWLESAPWAG